MQNIKTYQLQPALTRGIPWHVTLEALQGQLLHKARPAFTPAEVKAAIVHLPNEAARLAAAHPNPMASYKWVIYNPSYKWD